MDLTQLEGVPSRGSEMLFFMGQDDLNLRDRETEEDLAYWEAELPNEDTTITDMVRAEQKEVGVELDHHQRLRGGEQLRRGGEQILQRGKHESSDPGQARYTK